ncbi:MAG: extracellular solute-binding protein [Lachnospiraceae bacterium]|nr:extracellular solute-binding protein [Lachnospiraceae bacterium]MCH4070070.1 extracellular solute-binding protein [Lachnospiraceae bacterium]MCH4108578.1 extracellular solute-binding protein [Lachnospiraceae bacterium]MCI1302697.1 extracellular solute-binding protein [Lachnospiraceae bacterium]MCI1331881.1 extracellular solute-binding protein [Lachnospiraceae bacterium]
MNKRVMAVMLAMTTACGLTACGSQGTGATTGTADAATKTTAAASTTTDTGQSADGEPVEIDFWHSMGGVSGNLISQIVDSYNASQSKYHVTATYQGDYFTSIANAQTAIASGNGPALIQCGAGLSDKLSDTDGVVANLYDYLNKDEGLSRDDFYDSFIYMYEKEKNGEKYLDCIPMGSSTPVLYCNKTLLDKAGVSIPKTWDEMKEACATLVDGGYCDYGFDQPRDSWYFWMAIPNFTGKEVFSADGLQLDCKDEVVKTYTFAQDLIKKNYMYPGPASESGAAILQMMQSQQCAFCILSVGGLKNQETAAEAGGYELVVSDVPAGATKDIPSGGNVLVMLEGDQKKKDGAWDFLKWMYTNDDGLAKFIAGSGYLAPTDAVKNAKPVQEMLNNDANYKKAYSAIDNVNSNYYKVKGYSSMATPIMTFMDAVFYDLEDPAAQYDVLKEACDEALAEANEK